MQGIELAEVGGDADGVAADCPKSLLGLVAGVGLAAGDGDPGAGGDEALGDRSPDATGAARDDRDPSRQVEEDRSWSWFIGGLSHRPARRWPSLWSQVYGFGSGRGKREVIGVRRRLVVVVVCVATTVAGAGLGAAHAAPPSVANPVVEGPNGQTGLWGHPWNDQFFEVGSIGYAEEEYFVSGTTKTYTATPATAPYKTRILVYRPIDPRRFNGTTIVEWDNVTAQNAEEPMWTWLHPMVFPRFPPTSQCPRRQPPSAAGPSGTALGPVDTATCISPG